MALPTGQSNEPTNNLGPEVRRIVWQRIREGTCDGRTVILVTHNVVEAEAVLDRVAIIRRGQILAMGTPGELKARVTGNVRLELLFRPETEKEAAGWLAERSAVRPKPRYALSWVKQFELFRLQVSEYRASLPFFVVFSILMPIGFLYVFGTADSRQGMAGSWFLAGDVVVSVCFGASSFAIGRVAWLRLRRENDFYGTLPVKRSAFLATLFCLGLISTLPGMAANLLLGSWQLGIPLQNTLAAVPLTLLAAASLTLVGAAIGGLVRTQAEVNLYSNLLILVVTLLSPVLIPVEKMPRLFRLTSYLLPPGQAAMAITDALRGEYGPRFWILFGLLCLWLLASGVIVARRLDWRAD